MYHVTITNPKTNRQNKVRVFPIESKDAIRILNKDGARALSWELLDQKESLTDMGNEMGGESSKSNFALSVFENALDYSLGLLVLHYLQAYSSKYPGKQPKTVRVAVNRSGNLFILRQDHSIVYQS